MCLTAKHTLTVFVAIIVALENSVKKKLGAYARTEKRQLKHAIWCLIWVACDRRHSKNTFYVL